MNYNYKPSVLFNVHDNKGVITLNRPEKNNAINYDMIQQISDHLIRWQNKRFLLVIIKGNERAFSAGGDFISMLRWKDGHYEFNEFAVMELYLVYTLVGLIPYYKPNYISFMDGFVLGGGAGLSIHGKYRIVTERTVFAMPETAIGFFPDVGATYFLSRLPGRFGMYLGLTGAKLEGQEIVFFGLGTHYVPSDLLSELEEKLMHCTDDSEIEVTLDCYHRYMLQTDDSRELELKEINACFNATCVEEILERLMQYGNRGSRFCLKTYEQLMQKSPTSLKITFQALNRAKTMDLVDCLNMEYRMASRCVTIQHQRKYAQGVKEHSDLKEGLRALLIDKDKKPLWYPSTLKDVSQELVDSYFLEADNSSVYRLKGKL